jgi:hypothetical protein
MASAIDDARATTRASASANANARARSDRDLARGADARMV